MRLAVYGDSNALGYDPRLGGENLPPEACFGGLAATSLGLELALDAMEGRTVPRQGGGFLSFMRRESGQVRLLCLGTNDLLLGRGAKDTADAWRRALMQCRDAGELQPERVLFMTPPPLRGLSETMRLEVQDAYARIAEDFGMAYFDAQALPLQLYFDGIHLTREDHAVLAEALLPVLAALMGKEKADADN